MVEIYDVDQVSFRRNDPNAIAAYRAIREWNVLDRKDQEVAVNKKSIVEAKQAVIVAYGEALLEGKKRYPALREFHHWIEISELNAPPFSNPQERSNAMKIAVLGSNLKLTECPESWPSNILKWARKAGLLPVKKRNPEATVQARERVRAAVENGDPIGRTQIAEDLGTHNSTVDVAIAFERGRLEGIAEGEALALNEQGKFTKAQAKHVEALIKKFKRDLDAQFTVAVEKQVNKLVAARKTTLDQAREAVNKQRNDVFRDQQHWKKLINNHKPLFTAEEFRAIVMALHPDNSASSETRARALQSVNEKKLQLTGKA